MAAEPLPSAQQLIADAAALDVRLDGQQAAQLLAFGQALLRWNRAFNLISRKDEDRLYHRHLLDSLSVLPALADPVRPSPVLRVLDVGSGPGLPGVPLAIASPSSHFELIDRNARRMRFVDQTARSLKLENVTTCCGDVRALAASVYDAVVMRAVVDAGDAWALAGHLVAPAGRMVIMASGQTPGGDTAGQADVAAAQRVSGIWAQRIPVRIPGLPVAHEIQILSRLGCEPRAAAPETGLAESQPAEQGR